MTAAALKVVTLNESNFRDPVATLRGIADEIERGEYGAVGSLAFVMMGKKLEVFTAGPDSDAPTAALLFQAAILRLARTLEEIDE